MELQALLSSGIIEMYCMGLASDDEKKLVEEAAAMHSEVREEIASISEALQLYALGSGKSPSVNLKNKILDAVLQSESSPALPPLITMETKAEEWFDYLKQNNISEPASYEHAFILDLPGNSRQVTYVVWARKGAVVEESHDSEDEYLLMLKGNCSVTQDGVTKYYKEGDVIYIPKNVVHRAEALSDEPMVLIGQRVAA
jgi:quercetin dioxygenase-like cupin family protein